MSCPQGAYNSDVLLLSEVFSAKLFSLMFNFNTSINIIAKLYAMLSAF